MRYLLRYRRLDEKQKYWQKVWSSQITAEQLDKALEGIPKRKISEKEQ
jgi:hypothetical protein